MMVFLQKCAEFYEFVDWLATPSVMPCWGALFAVVAAMTAAPRSCLSFRKVLTRLLIVLLVWLTLAWLYRAAVDVAGNGQGRGAGRSAAQAGSGGPDLPTTNVKQPMPPVGAEALGWLPDNCILRIAFVSLESDPRLPRDFSCYIQYRSNNSSGNGLAVAAVQADNMDAFVAGVVKHLREIALAHRPDPVARVCMFPYPGEGVLRTLKQKIQLVCRERNIDIRIEDEVRQ